MFQRFVATLALVLAFLGQFNAFVHMATVQHTLCVHGDLIDVVRGDGHVHTGTSPQRQVIADSANTDDHDTHCVLWSHAVDRTSTAPSLCALPTFDVVTHTIAQPIEAPARTTRTYRLAPKQSPPVV